MKMIEQFQTVEAEERLTGINGWVQAAPQRYAAEFYSSFSDFVSHLRELTTTANAAVAGPDVAQNAKLRAELTYAAAIYRDCRYSLMHRGRLQELGIHNMFREAYEVGRFAQVSDTIDQT